ncbi:DUF2252 domain-containing protein [Asaia krungthepensis]|uniref:DUF2252 domain-containing protein n=1 Tax=Asaia krungthepensis NRIC 0535 TaxID=1307925 RepID=A0ABQ0PYT4_9PROT|nr:DUF2252 domain-containing protein [Asaia krungthepensis]GBQ84958.1 hypothetical protein AA0535_0637 [Asaia krungthepensis NRIC 0535]
MHLDDLETREVRHAQGRHLRKILSRSAQAEWSPPADRADPVSLLAGQGQSRIQSLLPIRYERMRASPFAFLRGSAIVMAADLASTASTGVMVQSCGDCHLANFGSYASTDGLAVFDINDFDETYPAPFEWDLKRLGASFVLASLENGLPEKQARANARIMAATYQGEMARLAPMSPLEIWADRIDLASAIEDFSDKHTRKSIRDRLEARLDSARAHFGLVSFDKDIPHLKVKPPLVMRLPDEDDTIREAFDRYLATQPPERGLLLSRYRLKDTLFKVVGVGSVGTYCAIGLFATADGETLLLQIKEAQESVLAAHVQGPSFANQGQRVVAGQRLMQATSDTFLGWTHTNTAEQPGKSRRFDGANKQFYVRRLKDSRLAAIGADVAQEGLDDYAALCGRALARAHARSGDVAMIHGYLGSGDSFAEAVADFSTGYAAQTRADWERFCASIDSGHLMTA